MKNLISKSVFMLGSLCLALLLGGFAANAAGAPHAALPLGAGLFAVSQLDFKLPAGSLLMGINAKNITWTQGRLNPGGTANRIFFANAEDIATYPAAMTVNTETALTFEELVTIPADDPFVMKDGAFFHELYCTIDEGEVKSELKGVIDGMSWENSFDGSYPGSEAEFLGFMASFANRDLVCIIPERNGNYRVVGCPFYPAKLTKASGTSGKKVTDGRSVKYTITDANGTPAPIYKAVIPLQPAPAPAGNGG